MSAEVMRGFGAVPKRGAEVGDHRQTQRAGDDRCVATRSAAGEGNTGNQLPPKLGHG